MRSRRETSTRQWSGMDRLKIRFLDDKGVTAGGRGGECKGGRAEQGEDSNVKERQRKGWERKTSFT